MSKRTVMRRKKMGVTGGDIVSLSGGDISVKGDTRGDIIPNQKPDDRFDEAGGRGVIRDGMVRVSVDPSSPESDRMVSEIHWRERMEEVCVHKLRGWSCTPCTRTVLGLR